jgi:hypothetical protein
MQALPSTLPCQSKASSLTRPLAIFNQSMTVRRHENHIGWAGENEISYPMIPK